MTLRTSAFVEPLDLHWFIRIWNEPKRMYAYTYSTYVYVYIYMHMYMSTDRDVTYF